MLSSFLRPANRCSSPIKDSKTNASDVRPARRSVPKAVEAEEAEEEPPRCERKPRPPARNAAKKQRFPSGRRKDARCSAGNASKRGDRWEQLKFQVQLENSALKKGRVE